MFFLRVHKAVAVDDVAVVCLFFRTLALRNQMISESVYQAREPEYELRDRRDKSGGACYCFNVYTDTKCPEDSMVVDADR